MKCFKYRAGKKSDYRIKWIQARPAKTFEQKQTVYFGFHQMFCFALFLFVCFLLVRSKKRICSVVLQFASSLQNDQIVSSSFIKLSYLRVTSIPSFSAF